MPFQAQPTEKCTACGKTVYLTEKTVVEEKTDKKIYHKQCIRCSTCNKVLAIGQYSSMDGQFWCKPHFKQLFATKGNYDEAFGKEKVTSKWDNNAAPTSPPSSFIPSETKSEAEKEKKPTSEATASKFRQFREQADNDRCSSCGKTVYLAEKLLVEDKNDKKLFHKRCFTCTTCNMILDLRSYGSFGGKIYCKNHLKEQQGVARPSGGSGVSAPTSFIPATEEKKTEKGQTPDNIASKFKGAETEKCKSCGKSVYATEKVTLPESFKQQSIYHKTCLKCSVCSCKLDVSNYGSANGALFCQTHLKQYGKPEQAKGDYFVSPLANANPDYVAGPRDTEASGYSDKEQDSQRDERDNDRERDSDRDEAEQRRQDSDREDRNEPQRSVPERTSSFSSTGRESPAIERGSGRSSPAIERASDSDREQQQSSPSLERKFETTSLNENSASASRERTSSRSEAVSGGDDDDFKRREAERARKREERQKAIEVEERQQEEERERRKRERERRLAESEAAEGDSSSSSTSGGGESREAERERRRKEREEERRREEEEREKLEEKRKKEREDKRKEQEEDMKRELQEQEKKAEERRRKLAELKGSD